MAWTAPDAMVPHRLPSDTAANDDLEIFLEAARTDIKAPYPRPPPDIYGRFTDEQWLADLRYREAASRVLGEPVHDHGVAASTIARVLAQTSDPRGPRALADWAMRQTTDSFNVHCALTAMKGRPHSEYLPAVKALVASDRCEDEGSAGMGIMDLALYSEAVGLTAYVSRCGYALSVAAEIQDENARAFLRQIAMDPSARNDLLTCPCHSPVAKGSVTRARRAP